MYLMGALSAEIAGGRSESKGPTEWRIGKKRQDSCVVGTKRWGGSAQAQAANAKEGRRNRIAGFGWGGKALKKSIMGKSSFERWPDFESIAKPGKGMAKKRVHSECGEVQQSGSEKGFL